MAAPPRPSPAPRSRPAGPREAPSAGGIPWPALCVLLAGAFVTVMDVFVVNVAVPSIKSDLRASDGAVQLIVAAYVLTYAALLILGGRLGDVRGPRRTFTAGMLLFSAASVTAALAPSIGTLVASRLAQGAGAALLFPQVLAGIQRLTTVADRRRVMGIFGAVIGSAAVSGQVVGGALLELDAFGLGWRVIFLFKLPLCVAILVGAFRILPRDGPRSRGPLDLAGGALAVGGLTLLIVPLIMGRELGWPPLLVASGVASVGLLAAFAVHERRIARRDRAPLLAPELFARSGFRTGMLVVLTFFSTQVGFYYVLTVVMQDGLGLSPLGAGLVYAPIGVTFLAVSTVAGRLAARHDRATLVAGALLLIASFAGMIVVTGSAATTTGWTLVPWLALNGVGSGLVVTPLYGVVLRGTPHRHSGTASAVLMTGQQLGNASGVALVGLVFYAALGDGSSPMAMLRAFDTAAGLLIGLLGVTIALILRLPPRGAEEPTA